MSTNDTAPSDLVAVDAETAGRSHSSSTRPTPSSAATNRKTAEYASMRRVMGRFA